MAGSAFLGLAPGAEAPVEAHAHVRVHHAAAAGRTRLRLPHFRGRADLLAVIARRLSARAGVRHVQENGWTGSLLVDHDKQIASDAIAGYVVAILEHGIAAPLRAAAGAADGEEAWHAMAPQIVTAAFASKEGLTGVEAAERLSRVGENRLPEPAPPPRLETLLRQFRSPPIALLGGSAALSVFTGRPLDAALTSGVIGLNAAIGFATEDWTDQLIRRLARPHDPDATVLRGGQEVRTPSSLIAPGDWIVLKSGAPVPADARLITADALMIDESSLTGESLPIEKDAHARLDAETPLPSRRTMVYRGGVVTGGEGLAVVTATGEATEIGRVRALLGETTPPPPPLERALARMSVALTFAVFGASAALAAALRLRGLPWTAVMRSSIAMAVAAIPEGLPAIAASSKAIAARTMTRENALVRNINVVETAANVDVLCLDKTGTLTLNSMAVACVHTFRERHVFDPHTPVEIRPDPVIRPLARVATLCNDARHDEDALSSGSGTERALLAWARQAGIDVAALRSAHARADHIARSGQRPYMATEHELDGAPFIAVKGAPQHVLALCDAVRSGKARKTLDDAARAEIMRQNLDMAREGLRVLGFAQARGQRLAQGELQGLEWLGLIGLADPLRPNAGKAIAACQRAGIRTIILTGDQAPTAERLARDLGVANDGSLDIIDAPEIRGLRPEKIAELARTVEVFARVSPSDKLTIVKALQDNGHVVAMTGDSVNDGPALRAADIGVAMGKNASDVARDVADIVIADDDIMGIPRALARGRAADENIRRAVRFLLATNASEVILLFAEAIHGPEALESPGELLWLNVVTDVFPALGIALAPAPRNVFRRPPRPVAESVFTRNEARTVMDDAFKIALPAILTQVFASLQSGLGPRTRGLTFLSLATAQLLHALRLQPAEDADATTDKDAAQAVGRGVAVSFALLAVPFVLPVLRRALRIAPPTPLQAALILGFHGARFLFAHAGRKSI